MSPRIKRIGFSDGNREALIIRWRVILILGLIDFLNNESKFSKIIVREILDISEGIIKALGESLEIDVRNKQFMSIFYEVQNNPALSQRAKDRIQRINESLSADEMNSVRNLFRNPDAHTLNLPTIPQESLMRCWRLLKELGEVCDHKLLQYANHRPELRDFYNMQQFFYDHIIDEKSIDWRKIKLFTKRIRGRDEKGRVRDIEITEEKTVSQIIEYISEGDWQDE